MRKSIKRYGMRKGRRIKVNVRLKTVAKFMDQEFRRIMNERLRDWFEIVRKRLTNCWERENEAVKTHKVWKIARNSTVTFSGKILNHVREIWIDNLKVKTDVRIVKTALKRKGKIKRTSKVKSLWNKVKETLGAID